MKTPKTIYLKDYTPSAFLIDETFLKVELFDEATIVTAKLKIRRNPKALQFSTVNTEKILKLNGKDLKTLSVLKNGTPIDYEIENVLDESLLKIEFLEDSAEIETVVKIFPQKNTALLGFYKSKNGYFTQCEAQSFRAITWFLDRPDVMSLYTVRLEAEKKRFPILLSNGNLENSGDLEHSRHFALWRDPFKKPSYLFAMVFADLGVLQDSYTTKDGKNVALYIYAEEGRQAQLQRAMAALKKAMAWDEKRFNLSCDLARYSIVAVDDFNMGAMENKGLNIFNSKYVLADEKTATDADFEAIDDVIAHEYFHNWTGNRITCRDWFQLSLKEGLTVYREQLFSADTHDKNLARIKEARLIRSAQFVEDAGPMAHPVRPDHYMEINNFYTVTVYEKGAELIRMMASIIGDAAFNDGMAEYFRRYDGTAATIEDFVSALESASGFDFKEFMPWYHTAGTPSLKIATDFSKENQRLTIKITQENPKNPAPVLMPIAIALFSKSGKKIIEKTLLFKEKSQDFVFENIESEPIASFLRRFSAPVKVELPFSTVNAIFLLKNEDDPFAAFDAAKSLFQHFILAGENLPESFIAALSHLLQNVKSRGAGFVSEIFLLPSLASLATHLEKVDILQLFKSRESIIHQIAKALNADFLNVFNALSNKTNLTKGERALKNRALQFLTEIETPENVARTFQSFQNATNMTDEFAALNILANLNGNFDERTNALESFYKRYQNEDLVLCKWLQCQATSRRADCLSNVQNLTKHAAFSMDNPNKVYALIRAFASNLLHFHSTIGAYEFVIAQIRYLNEKNPSVAARLLRAFDDFQKFGNESRARAALDSLKSAQLSRDVFEILKKIKG